MKSRLYRGTLFHIRHQPKQHQFQYQVFMPFVHLQALPELVDHMPLWSARRLALACFRRSDFLGDPSVPLIEAVNRRIEEETGERFEGDIFLLANWRYFGFQSNPIACYFCYGANGELQYLVAEVTNTPWGERHSYVLKPQPGQATLTAQFGKAMHVSPFNPMDMQYHWRSSMPDEQFILRLSTLQNGERVFDATLSLMRTPITGRSLTTVLACYPAMTLKVVAAIYWQALKLKWKKTPFFPHPNKIGGSSEKV